MKKVDIYTYVINTPRKENGDLSDEVCDYCGNAGSVLLGVDTYISEDDYYVDVQICKTCLLNGVDRLDKAMLKDAKVKGLQRKAGLD